MRRVRLTRRSLKVDHQADRQNHSRLCSRFGAAAPVHTACGHRSDHNNMFHLDMRGARISSACRSDCGTIATVAEAPKIGTNAIVAAISAGAVAGASDTAKVAIADAYQGLKSLVKKKFGHDSDAAEAIEKPSPTHPPGRCWSPKNSRPSTPPSNSNWSPPRIPCSP
jgi:hypothetical protein